VIKDLRLYALAIALFVAGCAGAALAPMLTPKVGATAPTTQAGSCTFQTMNVGSNTCVVTLAQPASYCVASGGQAYLAGAYTYACTVSGRALTVTLGAFNETAQEPFITSYIAQ
jgi:hypothetical protein